MSAADPRNVGEGRRALVHLGAGIGNVVLATPLLVALDALGLRIDLWLSADYPQTASLFSGWGLVETIHERPTNIPFAAYDVLVPAIPPFYWPRFEQYFRGRQATLSRPPDARFYADEQGFNLDFARRLGWQAEQRPVYRLPVAPNSPNGAEGPVTSRTLVLLPGCKTGEMCAKRWPGYPQLAECFDDVAVLGTADDLVDAQGCRLRFPPHVKLLVDALSLRETAEALAAAGVVVGNDSGLSHVAAATGAPTVMLFGPTPHRTLGRLPGNVQVLRSGLACEPCWFGARLAACSGRIDCLRGLTVAQVADAVGATLGDAARGAGPRRPARRG